MSGRLRCRGMVKWERGQAEVLKRLPVLSVRVLMLSALCGPQETTTGRRPTIQTTVTASLTKSSLGACNQM